ncbi:MAG: hypothetical protein ACI8ZM_003856 [Crocinitomix sp.]|jgi:hypothetical protein
MWVGGWIGIVDGLLFRSDFELAEIAMERSKLSLTNGCFVYSPQR